MRGPVTAAHPAIRYSGTLDRCFHLHDLFFSDGDNTLQPRLALREADDLVFCAQCGTEDAVAPPTTTASSSATKRSAVDFSRKKYVCRTCYACPVCQTALSFEHKARRPNGDIEDAPRLECKRCYYSTRSLTGATDGLSAISKTLYNAQGVGVKAAVEEGHRLALLLEKRLDTKIGRIDVHSAEGWRMFDREVTSKLDFYDGTASPSDAVAGWTPSSVKDLVASTAPYELPSTVSKASFQPSMATHIVHGGRVCGDSSSVDEAALVPTPLKLFCRTAYRYATRRTYRPEKFASFSATKTLEWQAEGMNMNAVHILPRFAFASGLPRLVMASGSAAVTTFSFVLSISNPLHAKCTIQSVTAIKSTPGISVRLPPALTAVEGEGDAESCPGVQLDSRKALASGATPPPQFRSSVETEGAVDRHGYTAFVPLSIAVDEARLPQLAKRTKVQWIWAVRVAFPLLATDRVLTFYVFVEIPIVAPTPPQSSTS